MKPKPDFHLKQLLVYVSGVPYQLRHFFGLWGVGSMIGTTMDVDLLALRRHDIVRILVGMLTTSVLQQNSSSGGTHEIRSGDLSERSFPSLCLRRWTMWRKNILCLFS